MGCWNETCALTTLPIKQGERAVWMPLISNGYGSEETTYCEAWDLFKQAGFILRGTYNDYGAIENIDDTPQARITLEYFKNQISKDDIEISAKGVKDGYKLDTLDDLVKIIERECLEHTNPSIIQGARHIKRYGFMMMHENAYDLVLANMKKRCDFEDPIPVAVYLEHRIREWLGISIPYEKDSVEYSQTIFLKVLKDYGENRFIHALYNSIDDGHYYLLRIFEEKLEDLVPALVDTIMFCGALGLLRKMYAPQCGKGGQGNEMYLHKLLGDFVSKHISDELNEYEEENINDPSIDQRSFFEENLMNSYKK
jgi:hypothetical protein